MKTQLVPVELDGVTLVVEAAVTPGSEDTSTLDDRVERINDAFDRLPAILTSISKRLIVATQELSHEAMKPSEISAEFGLKVSATGQVILVSGTAEASLSVTLTYKS